jgi:hypothetical protein
MRTATLIKLTAFGLLLAGCTAAGDKPERMFVAPGKYVLYDCAQLAHAEASFVARDRELTRLKERAQQGPAGGMISTLVYDPDYYSNLGELNDVRREQAEKNCGTRPASPARPPAR